MKKRLLSFVLILAMVLSIVPAMSITAWAEKAVEISYQYPVYNDDDATKGIKEWKTSTAACEVITNSDTRVTWEAGWYVVNGNITISGGAVVNGEVHLILADDCNFTITDAATKKAGIKVSGNNNSLSIYGQANGTGTLNVTGGNNAAGIGGDEGQIGSNITINGGKIIATGGSTAGAGIGGGFDAAGTDITINGGVVTATGIWGSAGIGGSQGDGKNITIRYGTVTAKGSVAIGGCGIDKQSSNIFVGDDVVVKGSEYTFMEPYTIINHSSISQSIASELKDIAYIKITPKITEYFKPIYNIENDVTSGLKEMTKAAITTVTKVESSESRVTWTAGWYVVSGDISLSKGAVVSGEVHLILSDGASLMISGVENSNAGIAVTSPNSLTIYAQSTGNSMGVLTVAGGKYGAGIGGGDNKSGSNITINGGAITATGNYGGAGIGGGNYGTGSSITINGGTITATVIGNFKGSCIGGGYGGDGSNIFINKDLILKADNNNPPTTVIENNGTEDLTSKLSGKQYAKIELPQPIFDDGFCGAVTKDNYKTWTHGDYTLEGWYYDKQGTLTKLLDSEEPENGVTYTAKWKKGEVVVLTEEVHIDGLSSDKTGDGWSWNNTTKTLTLSGMILDLTDKKSIVSGIIIPNGANVVLGDQPTTINVNNTSSGGTAYGLHSMGEINISGEGKLVITSSAIDGTSYGLSTNGAKITIDKSAVDVFADIFPIYSSNTDKTKDAIEIKNGAKVTAKASANGYCISALSGNVIITDKDTLVTLKGCKNSLAAGTMTSEGSILIKDSAVVDIENGTANATAVFANQNITVESEAALNVTMKQNVDTNAQAVYALKGDIKVDNATVKVLYNSHSFTDERFGIFADKGNVTIQGNKSDVTVSGGSIGILCGQNSGSNDNTLTISAGKVSADNGITALWAKANMDISGGTISAISHGYNTNKAKAIYSQGTINISGNANVTANCVADDTPLEAKTQKYYAIRAKGNITISDEAVVTAVGSTAAFNLETGKKIYAKGATITANDAVDATGTILNCDVDLASGTVGGFEAAKYMHIVFEQAKIGTTTYASLQKAVYNAQSGDTITLIKDVAEDVSYYGKDVKIALNGYKLKGNQNASSIKLIIASETDMQNAINVAPASCGQIWEIENDIELTQQLRITDRYLTVNGNGKSIVGTSGALGNNTLSQNMIAIDSVNADSRNNVKINNLKLVGSDRFKNVLAVQYKDDNNYGIHLTLTDVSIDQTYCRNDGDEGGTPLLNLGSDITVNGKFSVTAGNKSCYLVGMNLASNGAVLTFDDSAVVTLTDNRTSGQKTSRAAIYISGRGKGNVATVSGVYVNTKLEEVKSASEIIGYNLKPVKTPVYHGGGTPSIPFYNISANAAVNGSISVSNANANSGNTVTITVKPADKYELDTLTAIDAQGNAVTLTTVKEGTTYTFVVGTSDVTVSATFKAVKEEKKPFENPFVDVVKEEYYYDAVLWAAENGITSGADETHFAPGAITTRAQMVTFLWRAAGCPEPTKATAFTDLEKGSYYEKAVAWAVEKGITNGTSDTKFSPEETVNRAQTVTFLARYNGVLDSATGYTHAFKDVLATEYYNNAVAWAASNGITSGISETQFAPEDSCIRAQIVTFLYRSEVK